MFLEKMLKGNFAKFTGKHLCRCFFFNKVAGLTQFSRLRISQNYYENLFFYRAVRATASNCSGSVFTDTSHYKKLKWFSLKTLSLIGSHIYFSNNNKIFTLCKQLLRRNKGKFTLHYFK